DAVDGGEDVAATGVDRGRARHRRSVRAAAPERGDAAGLLVHALEAGDDRDLLALLEPLDQLLAIDIEDAGRAMGVGGHDRQLPALPGPRIDADALEHDREQAGRHLLTRGDDRVVFAGIMQGGGLAAPGHQFVGLARHRRYDHGDVVAGIDLAPDVVGDVADALDVGDGGSAELHHQAGHAGWSLTRRRSGFLGRFRPEKASIHTGGINGLQPQPGERTWPRARAVRQSTPTRLPASRRWPRNGGTSAAKWAC